MYILFFILAYMENQENPQQEKRGRGRPRTRPLPDPNAPKKPKGRPRKEPKFEASLNIEIPASKYIKNGYKKSELSETDKINMSENVPSILDRAVKSGFTVTNNPQDIRDIPTGTFVKYITTLNQFRIGGILRSVDSQLRYFTLYNPKLKSSWSVQMKTIKYLMFKTKKKENEDEK